jgi:hypothetical protein
MGVEPGDETAEEPGGRGSEHAEPEELDVRGPGIVTAPVDDGVDPRGDSDARWQGCRFRLWGS